MTGVRYTVSMAKKKEDKIYNILLSIDNTLTQQNSFKRTFTQGLVRGFGTALGATVLLALATSLTIQLVDSLDWHAFSSYFFTEVVEE